MNISRAQWLAVYDVFAEVAAVRRITLSFGLTTDKNPVEVTATRPAMFDHHHVKGTDLTKLAAEVAEKARETK